MPAKDATNRFGMLLVYARVLGQLRSRYPAGPAIVVISAEEFQRLNKPVKRQDDAVRERVKVSR